MSSYCRPSEKLRLGDPALAAERPSLSRARQMASMLSAPTSQPRPKLSLIDRVLVIAADKGNAFWPSNDPLDELEALISAMRTAREAEGMSINVTAVKGKTLRHPWHISNPKLCMGVINRFLQDVELPKAFEAVPL